MPHQRTRSLADGTGRLVRRQSAESRPSQNLPVNVRLIRNSPVHTYSPGCCSCHFASRATARSPIQRRNADFVGSGSSIGARRSPRSILEARK